MLRTDIITTEWRDLPDGGSTPEHLFAIGDVHGRADLLEGMLEHLEALPRLAYRHLVFLGDLADRGPEGLRAINLAWDAKERFEKRTCLPGNHEIALTQAVRTPRDEDAFIWWYQAYKGHAVCDELSLPETEQTIDGFSAALDRALPEGFLDGVAAGPGHVKSGDLLLVHAGIHPVHQREKFLGLLPLAHYNRDCHWSMIRDDFLDWTHGWDHAGLGPTVVVHGHTVPIRERLESMEDFLAAADRIHDRRRIALDMGAVFYGHLAALEAQGRRYRLHLAFALPDYRP